MNSLRLLTTAALALTLLITMPAQVTAQQERLAHRRNKLPSQSVLRFQHNAPGTRMQSLRPGPAHLPLPAKSAVVPTACPPEADGAVCGFVNVPLDRKHPEQAQIPIYFELYPHTRSGSEESAIVGDPGCGGGDSTTVNNRFFFRTCSDRTSMFTTCF